MDRPKFWEFQIPREVSETPVVVEKGGRRRQLVAQFEKIKRTETNKLDDALINQLNHNHNNRR